jgi:DNA-binding response OmpR family regulator
MKKKILIVEDDSQLRELLRMNFRAEGFSVATAGNGIDALSKSQLLKPDLVLLDLVLPELDGFAVCEALRRAPAMAEVPIIVVTGLTSELARLAVLESGANDFVLKPVNPSCLVTKIRQWLSRPPTAVRQAPVPGASRLLARVE